MSDPVDDQQMWAWGVLRFMVELPCALVRMMFAGAPPEPPPVEPTQPPPDEDQEGLP